MSLSSLEPAWFHDRDGDLDIEEQRFLTKAQRDELAVGDLLYGGPRRDVTNLGPKDPPVA